MSGLPEIIPVFPLPNVVLFPGVQLPLHIFEPRYRAMVRDAYDSSPSLIGMSLLRGEDWRANYEGNPPIYAVGCVGEMVRMDLQPDGRSNILLQGVREYEVREELLTKAYRQARVTWRPPEKTSLAQELRQELRGLLRRYLPESANAEKFLADPSVEDAFFVNFFAFHLGLQPIEKQSLIEAVGLSARARCLRDILDFKLTESSLGKPKDDKSRMH